MIIWLIAFVALCQIFQSMKELSEEKQNPKNPDLGILQNTQSRLDYTKNVASATTFLVILSQIFLLSLDLNINKLCKDEMKQLVC